MKTLTCACGHRVFFDNTSCSLCGLEIGFDPRTLTMVTQVNAVTPLSYCRNHYVYEVCNWLRTPDDDSDFCIGCQRTEVIPSLEVPENVILWGRMEAAKRRALYSLLSLDLASAADGGDGLPTFRFLEDQRRNPAVVEEYVLTGHAGGTITINLAEADDVQRRAVSEQMLERYRTLLGHLRHECAHFYFSRLVLDSGRADDFRDVFGDERADYASAIERYHASARPLDWYRDYISAYASSHPHEDWAETFAHYLHIRDALETSEAAGLTEPPTGEQRGWIHEWVNLAVTLNELNRSLGNDDAYPFMLSDAVIRKLSFVDRLIRRPA